MIFDQSEYNIRCEWGEKGASLLAPVSDVIIIVDILSFSTSVEIATLRGAFVFPYRWKDQTAYQFADSVAAQVADGRSEKGYSLSPSTLQTLPPRTRIVLPSPNGSEISLSTGSRTTIAGCLRNCRAVAESAMRKGANIAVIPAGERWEENTLRPSLEDLIGAGAIIRYLRGTLSPEAEAALAAFERAASTLLSHIERCSSGKEKISRGEGIDIKLASELNVSRCVPIFENGCFRKEG